MSNWGESGGIVMYRNIKYYTIWKIVCKDKWSDENHLDTSLIRAGMSQI